MPSKVSTYPLVQPEYADRLYLKTIQKHRDPTQGLFYLQQIVGGPSWMADESSYVPALEAAG
jgi:hypothetical protein